VIQENITEMVKNKIPGVPTIIVNAKYRVLSHEDVKTQKDYFNLLNFLKNKP
jgi:hypothetical protein